ncbi:hypothetical protein AVEN_138933-1 [Araneus ventricosus]|uniref:Uncharacterized protein n=1 Tax=Araneus ventricosus TaxID=182803 RepID=A0A4Y2KA60_ARAVE|nr:hypothetical protein AVEN_138933-1 [Araneus ventricosus]
MFTLFIDMVSYDAAVTGFVLHVSLPYRYTMTIALTNFHQKHSRACSVSTHRTLPYSQARLVVRSRLRDLRVLGSKPDSTEEPPCKRVWCTFNPSGPKVLPLVWCKKMPTLARPTQEGCKAGRGPARREPLH